MMVLPTAGQWGAPADHPVAGGALPDLAGPGAAGAGGQRCPSGPGRAVLGPGPPRQEAPTGPGPPGQEVLLQDLQRHLCGPSGDGEPQEGPRGAQRLQVPRLPLHGRRLARGPGRCSGAGEGSSGAVGLPPGRGRSHPPSPLRATWSSTPASGPTSASTAALPPRTRRTCGGTR